VLLKAFGNRYPLGMGFRRKVKFVEMISSRYLNRFHELTFFYLKAYVHMVEEMELGLERIRQKILPVLRRHGVKKAAVFGSFARGEGKKDSDLDLLVELGSEKSLLDLASLKVELEESLKMRVDVLTYNSLHPLLKGSILNEQKVIA